MEKEKLNKVISKKKIGLNLISNIVSFGTQIVLSFFLTPFLIKSLGKDLYSFYPIATNIVTYMTIVTTALNTMAARFITVSLVRNNIDDAKRYFSTLLLINIILAGLLCVPSILIIIFLDKILNINVDYVGEIKILFTFVFASAIINVISNIFGVATFAKNRIDLRSIREIVASILRLFLFIILYKFCPTTIIYVGLVALVIAVFNLIVQFFYTKKLMPEISLTSRYSDIRLFKILISNSIWNVISSLGAILLCGTSLILSNLYLGESASGTYSIIQTIPNLFNSLISMLFGVFFPVITYKYAQNDKDALIEELLKNQKLISTLGLAILFVFAGFSEDFFSLWTPLENNKELFNLSLILLIQYVFVTCFWGLYNLSIVMTKVKIPALLELVLGIINILLSYILCKKMEMGLFVLPLISSSLTIFWIGIFYPIYISKLLNIKIFTFYKTLIVDLLFGTLLFTLIIMFRNSIRIDSWFKFILFGGLFGIGALILFFIANFGLKNIFRYVRRKKK